MQNITISLTDVRRTFIHLLRKYNVANYLFMQAYFSLKVAVAENNLFLVVC